MTTIATDAPYSERLWVPWWIHPAVVVPTVLVVAAIGWVADGNIWVIVGVAAGMALWLEFLVVGTAVGRRIRRDGIWLRVGLGEKLDLRWVQSVEALHGETVDGIRRRMLDGPRPVRGASTAVVVGGQAGLAVGQFALAWSFFRGIKSRRGLICPIWVHDAVHVLTMDGSEWLIAARDPERLAATVRQGVAAAQATVPVPAEDDPV